MGWGEYARWQGNEGVRLLETCGVRGGMKVLDFGCGIGEYSIPAAIAVGENGKVISVDRDVHRVKALRENCVRWKLSNIHAVKGTENSSEIYNDPIDCVLYFDLYHGLGKDPLVRAAENQRVIQQITRSLNPNGLLLVSVFSEMCLIWDEAHGARTPKGALKAQKVSVDEGIRWFRMIETIIECGFAFRETIAGAVHFDAFYRKGEPDMEKFERGNIYVFVRKQSVYDDKHAQPCAMP